MDYHELYQSIKINDQYNKVIGQVSLRLNVKKIHNYDFNNLKKTKIFNQINRNDKQAQNMFHDQKQFTQNNIIETFPFYKHFQDDKQFLEKLDIIIKKLQIADNESNIKDNKSELIKILNEKEKNKYQFATVWMRNMSPNLQEFFDFYLQIYEVYKGIQQILGLQQKQEQQKVKGNFQNIILLHQNKNKHCGRLLHVGSFVQNLLLQNCRQPKFKYFRTLYINFTGENLQQDIDFWSFCHHNNKELSKFISFIPLNYNNSDQVQKQEQEVTKDNQEGQNDNYSKSEILFQKNTSQQTIFPILYDSILLQQQIQIIYSILLLPIINSFNPQFIYLDLQISNKFQIEFDGIEYLLRQLQKKANLIVYPCYQYETQKINEQNIQGNKLYNSYINAIVSGISGFKMIKTKTLNDNTIFKIFRWSNIMQKSYYQQNILMQKQNQFLNSQIQQYDSERIFYGIYQFAITIQNDSILWIIPLDCYRSQLKFTNYFCFYDQNIIVLFDQNNQSIYQQEISDIPKNSGINLQKSQQFRTLQIPKKLIEPSILIIIHYLIIIYGHDYSQDIPQFFDGILIFDLGPFEEFKEYKRIHNNKSENLLACIKNRRCPQICQNNGFKSNDQVLSFFLIGGEFMKSDHIQNFIEVVNVNLKTQTFYSYTINFEQINSQISLKPWPYQLVLEYNYQNIHFYLIQSGNYLLKLNKFQFPIDPNYHNYSQLLIQQDDSFKLYDISVKRQKQYYFKIEQLYTNSRNWILERNQCSDSQIVWKAYITRIVKLKSPLNCKILTPFEQQFKNMDYNTQFLICIELTIQLKIPQNHLDFQNYTVELDYKIMSLQNIQK